MRSDPGEKKTVQGRYTNYECRVGICAVTYYIGPMVNTDNQVPLRQDIPNPSELMRARHPDLFSDTRVDDAPRLSKAVFEYHLDTLTSRKQEYEFEHFCRKLAEKEICPNLRVQTGPTGGGDSKVDTETYPVAEEIAERWWIGSPAAATERWAFAFSAKKAWKPKVKADIDNILSTGRDYKRIYFFINQFVSDKERAAREDALSRHAGIPVHIVDRAWIVEKVYEAGHLELAIATLGIEDARSEKTRHPGPRDAARLRELEELDRQVADPSRYQGVRYQLVEDCLRSAILARGLERPRSEVESRFALADRLAQDLDYCQQRLRIAYNRAWTAYWWYEDYPAFSRFYDEVEQRVEGSIQAGEVELLLNLWQLLAPSVAAGRISAQDAKTESRRQRLAAMLEAIAADPARLNNALHARTGLTLMKITQAYQTGQSDQLESGWCDLSQIVDESATLGAYPLERLSDIVIELGEHVDSTAFDELYEKVVETVRQRRSDGEAGEAYTERGVQKLQQGKPYEAIQWFGRAEELLIKEEYRAELVMALIASSYAYERVSLLWAARNKALAAVERTLAVFHEQGEMIRPALLALQRLVWIELQLGRVPHILDAMTLAGFVASHLKLSEDRQEAYDEERQMQEAVLGIHFLDIPFESLPDVVRLPDALERLGLINARMALLYVLGHEQALRNEGYIPASEAPHAVQTFFELWQGQPAAKDIPPHPVLVDGTTSLLRSTILGSELVVETPNNPISFGVAESLLGALEAFLATSDEADVLPHRERTTIVVSASDQLTGAPQLHFPDDSGRAEIMHPANLEFRTATERQDYMQWLQESLVQIVCRILVIRDASTWIEKLAGQERGFFRALGLGDALTLNSNVFSTTPRLHLTDWLIPEDKNWTVLRDRPWRVEKPASRPDEPNDPPKFGAGPPPAELIDRARLKHADRHILSPIDIPLWDRAKWRATLFAWHPQALPMLALAFEDGQAGEAIFRAWRERWGNEDNDDALRLAIITGLSKQNPAEYAVVVGPNLRHAKNHEGKTFVFVSRINRMTPTSTANLDAFIVAYRRAGAFLLAPAQLGTGAPTPFVQLAITKRHLHIRQAWEIGENDPDASVLHDDDEPIIPAAVTDPPVNKALAQIRAFRHAHRPRP